MNGEALQPLLTHLGIYGWLLLSLSAACGAVGILVYEWSRAVSEQKRAVLLLWKILLILLSGGTLFCLWNGPLLNNVVLIGDSLYGAIRLFFVDGSLDLKLLPAHLADPAVLIPFGLVYYFVCIVAFLCTALTVLSYFRNLYNHLRLWRVSRRKGAYLYVFNEINERGLAVAADLAQNSRQNYRESNPRIRLVFCGADSHAQTNLISRAEALGAICFREEIQEIHRELRRRICRSNRGGALISGEPEQPAYNPPFHYFLIGEDESANVAQAISLAEDLQKSAAGGQNLMISVFAIGEADGRILDELNVGPDEKTLQPYVVRRIDPALLLAWHLVQQYPLIDPASSRAQRERHLNVLLVGAGQYGLAILKTLVWYYQRAAGSITVYVADRNKETEERLRGTCPDLLDGCNRADPNDACYDIRFFESADVFGATFARQFAGIPDPDAVIVALGDDDANIEASLHLRTLYDRRHYEDIAAGRPGGGCRFLAVVHNDVKHNNLKNFRSHGLRIEDYGIDYVGNYREVYSYINLYNPQKENLACYLNDLRKKQRPGFMVWDYVATEYNRLSSLSYQMHLDLLEQLYDDDTLDREGDRICNNRWNAYMRTVGYVNPDPDRLPDDAFFQQNPPGRQWHRGKWHTSITAYDRLGPIEQANNYTMSGLRLALNAKRSARK